MTFIRTIRTAALALALLAPLTTLASGGVALPEQQWGFHGIFGKFDNAALKRGAQVAVEVCMSCHSIKYIKFDALRQFGFTEQEIKTLAEKQGKTKKDKMLSSMDAEAAKGAFGVVPPDLSLMTKARKGYENYVYGLLTGYASDEEKAAVEKAMQDGAVSEAEAKELASLLHMDPHNPKKINDAAVRIKNGDNFNKYFPGHFLSMPQPVSAGQVEYADGTKNSLEQLSRDVVTFMAWAAEPTLMERKSTGINVMVYLLILTIMLYAVKRRVWEKLHGDHGHDHDHGSSGHHHH